MGLEEKLPSGILLSTTLSTVVFFMYFEWLMLPPKPRDEILPMLDESAALMTAL
mgnify:CR=1 FL=1